MKTFFLLAAAAALVSGQQVANPAPFARGPIANFDGSSRGGQPLFGSHPIPLVRLAGPIARYVANDGQTPMGGLAAIPFLPGNLGTATPNVRQVSNIVCGNQTSVRNIRRPISTLHTFWGQLVDHDLGLTDGVARFGPFPIDATGDPVFDPNNVGRTINFNRATFINQTVAGTMIVQREQVNDLTAWMDASMIYGETLTKANLLRGDTCRSSTSSCRGQMLLVPQGSYGLLPTVNQVAAANAGGVTIALAANPVRRVTDGEVRCNGDVRAQENNALESLHTVLTRDHNRCAINLANANPTRTSDEIFNECRFFGMAYIQNILYNEYAPLVLPSAVNGRLGQNLDATYQGYNASVRPDVFAEFSAALFRYGHSALPTEITRANPATNALLTPLDLQNAFFNPANTPLPSSIDEILAGLWQDLANQIDVFVVDDVRNQLFNNPAGNVAPNDLISFNLQRSRDHGLPTLNGLRTALGLTPWASFAALVGNQAGAATIADTLLRAYGNVNNVELWIGGVAEDGFRDGNVGETLSFVISLQYQNFRVADNYYFLNGWFSAAEVTTIQNTLISSIILRTTSIAEMPCSAFTYSPTASQMMCQNTASTSTNEAVSISFGAFSILAAIASFFF